MNSKYIAFAALLIASSVYGQERSKRTERGEPERNTNISFGMIRNTFFKDMIKNERYDTMYYGQGITLHVVTYLLNKPNYDLGFGTGISMVTRTAAKDGYKTAQMPFYFANRVTIDETKPIIPALLMNLGAAFVVDCKYSEDKDKYISMSTAAFNRLEGFVEMGMAWTLKKRLTVSLSFLYMSLGIKDLQPDDFHDNVMLKVGYNL